MSWQDEAKSWVPPSTKMEPTGCTEEPNMSPLYCVAEHSFAYSGREQH